MATSVPRLTYLRIKNYRALRDVEFRDLTPLTVLIGPNGSGKSTVLDALDFLAEAVRGNLVGAWEKRNRFEGMRTRGSEGNISFELNLIYNKHSIQYELELEEFASASEPKVFVADEQLQINNKPGIQTNGKYFGKSPSFYPFLNKYQVNGPDDIVSHVIPDHLYLATSFTEDAEGLDLYEALTVLKRLLTSYRLTHLTDDHLKGYSDSGPRERLSPDGENLPNVLYYLHLRHPEVLARITAKLKSWVPNLADVVPEITPDKRILLRFKDAPGDELLPARYISGGTMRLAALLTLLYEPNAAGLLGIEEPENELHPQLLHLLGEELGMATEHRQLLVATHSPAILNVMDPEQVWILHRGDDGYTQATRAADLPGIPEMVEDGSPLGYLWSRNFFDVGNPLDRAGATSQQ